MTNLERKLLMEEMEMLKNMSKILYMFMVVVLVALGGLLFISLQNARQIDYLVEDSWETKVDTIKTAADGAESDGLSNGWELSYFEQGLGYCDQLGVEGQEKYGVTEDCKTLSDYVAANKE